MCSVALLLDKLPFFTHLKTHKSSHTHLLHVYVCYVQKKIFFWGFFVVVFFCYAAEKNMMCSRIPNFRFPSVSVHPFKIKSELLNTFGLIRTEVQNWHVSPQCQFSAKCFSGQAWHSVGASALQWLFTAVPGGHWSHIRSSDVTGSRYWYFGGSPCVWKAQEREAVMSCRGEKNKYFNSNGSKMHENHDVNCFCLFVCFLLCTFQTKLPVKDSSQKGHSCKIGGPAGEDPEATSP